MCGFLLAGQGLSLLQFGPAQVQRNDSWAFNLSTSWPIFATRFFSRDCPPPPSPGPVAPAAFMDVCTGEVGLLLWGPSCMFQIAYDVIRGILAGSQVEVEKISTGFISLYGFASITFEVPALRVSAVRTYCP